MALTIEAGKVYQTRNGRNVEIKELKDVNGAPCGFGDLLPVDPTGNREQYCWRRDGSLNTNNPNTMGIPHQWDLASLIR